MRAAEGAGGLDCSALNAQAKGLTTVAPHKVCAATTHWRVVARGHVPRSNPPKEQTAVWHPGARRPGESLRYQGQGQPPGTARRREFQVALHANVYALFMEKAHVRRPNPVDHAAQRPAHRARRPHGALCRLFHAGAVSHRADGRAHHTRNAAGLFDVSHMGQLRLVAPTLLPRSRP